MSHKALVLGATGNVGSEIVRQLAAKKAAVRAAVRDPGKAKEKGWTGVETVAFAYDKPETFAAAFAGVDHVFVLSPVHPTVHQLVIPAIDAAKKAGVQHIVNMAAMGVESNDSIPLRIIEKHIEQSGMGYTFLRPNWFMQNFSGWVGATIPSKNAIFVPAADAKVSFIDVRDIAAVAVHALTDPGHLGKAYALTGPEALSHSEVAAQISKVAGKNIQYVAIRDEDMRDALQSMGWPEPLIQMMLGLFYGMRQGWNAILSPDVQKVLGRAPISFSQHAQEFAAHWK